MLFEYDTAKSRTNLRKHGIDFEEAITVFSDPLLLMLEDRTEAHEKRLVAIGRSENHRDLFVVHCYRQTEDSEEVIRIISARKLSSKEKRAVERLRL